MVLVFLIFSIYCVVFELVRCTVVYVHLYVKIFPKWSRSSSVRTVGQVSSVSNSATRTSRRASRHSMTWDRMRSDLVWYTGLRDRVDDPAARRSRSPRPGYSPFQGAWYCGLTGYTQPQTRLCSFVLFYAHTCPCKKHVFSNMSS